MNNNLKNKQPTKRRKKSSRKKRLAQLQPASVEGGEP